MKRSSVVKCSNCKDFHHNKPGCIFQGHKPSKRKRARLMKIADRAKKTKAKKKKAKQTKAKKTKASDVV